MHKLKIVGLVAVTLLFLSYVVTDYSMLQQASVLSTDSSTSMNSFAVASEWLAKMLKPDEKAIVPSAFVFEILNPELKGRLIDSQSIWDLAGVQLHERGSEERILYLQGWFASYLQNNTKIEFVVKDWVDEYTRYLYDGNSQLKYVVKEIKDVPFTLSTGWSNKIVIYQHTEYKLASYEDFSSNSSYHLYPSNISIKFQNNGIELMKNDQQIGFYLEFPLGLNCSNQSYVVLNTSFSLKNLTLTIVFYFDKNRDGLFNGYESSDYVKSNSFILSQDNRTSEQQYSLYQFVPLEKDPIVQIGLIFNGNENGSINLHNLTFFTVDSVA